MGIHQRKDGRYYVHFRDKQTGKTKKISFGRGPEEEQKANAFYESLGLRTYKRKTPTDNSTQFSKLVNAYARGRQAHVQPSTLENFMWKMKGVILPILGKTPAMNITHQKIDLYVQKRLRSVKRTTIHRELSDIRAVLNWAAKRRYIAFNPIAGYEMPKRDDAEILPPSPKEIELILNHSPDRLTRAICISYYTGLRPGLRELYSLKWENVDFDTGTITVISAKKFGKYKTRLVPIHPGFVEILKSWHRLDQFDKGFIIRYRGKPVKSLKKIYSQAKQKAGITRRLRLYDLRHAFATLLLKHNADLKSTSEILGHSRPDTTTRIYQHTDFEMHQAAVNKLPEIRLGTHQKYPQEKSKAD